MDGSMSVKNCRDVWGHDYSVKEQWEELWSGGRQEALLFLAGPAYTHQRDFWRNQADVRRKGKISCDVKSLFIIYSSRTAATRTASTQSPSSTFTARRLFPPSISINQYQLQAPFIWGNCSTLYLLCSHTHTRMFSPLIYIELIKSS